MDYPKREQFFAMRFLRLLTKSAAAMEIGTEGCMLLMVVVGQEDACRYSRPVNFWNAQLATLCGISASNETQLRRIRDRCVNAGWLVYESGGRRKHGRYFVAIPAHVDPSNDGGCDESPSSSVRQSDAETTPSERNMCADRAQSARNVCAECAPSIPNPIPNPIPKSAAAPPPAPRQAVAADPLDMDSMQAAPEPDHVTKALDRRTFADWRTMIARRIFWTREEDELWKSIFAAEGWDEMTKGYEFLAKKHPAPKKIFVSMFQEIRE
jgi:hypothetical protein